GGKGYSNRPRTDLARGPRRPGPRVERGTGPRGESPRPSPREGRLDRSRFVRPDPVQGTTRTIEGRSSTRGGRQPSTHPTSRRCEDRSAAATGRGSVHGEGREATRIRRSLRRRESREAKATR